MNESRESIVTHQITSIARRPSPLRLFSLLLLTLFFVEIGVMLAGHYLLPPELPLWVVFCVDAGLLTLICTPILWQAIQPLDETERHLRHLLNSCPYAAFLLDVDFRILAANPLGTRYLGQAAEDIAGRDLTTCLAGGAGMAKRDAMETIAETGAPGVFHDEMDGRRYRNIVAPAVQADGYVSGVVLFIEDVTDPLPEFRFGAAAGAGQTLA